jgi:hypothetical protein
VGKKSPPILEERKLQNITKKSSLSRGKGRSRGKKIVHPFP